MSDIAHAEAHPLMDAAEIEKQLVQLWREMSQGEKPVIRARVLTLVVAATEEEESRMAEWLMQLAERHPARNILLLLGEEEGPERLDAAATILCSTRGHTVCAEQIRIHAAGAARERVPSAVRMLLSPDLPVVLWWGLPPRFDDPLLGQLTGLAEQLFFDSAEMFDRDTLYRVLPTWQGENLTDLNWIRLTPWREMIAQFFDPPAHQALLAEMDRVTIEHGSCPVAAMLIAGWLASRLEWTLRDASEERWRFARPGEGEVTVRFIGSSEGANLQAVQLSAGGSEFKVRRTDGNLRCESDTREEKSIKNVVALDGEDIPALLSQALDYLRTDMHYIDALKVVQEAVEAQAHG